MGIERVEVNSDEIIRVYYLIQASMQVIENVTIQAQSHLNKQGLINCAKVLFNILRNDKDNLAHLSKESSCH